MLLYLASLYVQSKRKDVPKLKLVETEVLEEMRSRLELAEDERPPTPAHLATLRIKTEDGGQASTMASPACEDLSLLNDHWVCRTLTLMPTFLISHLTVT